MNTSPLTGSKPMCRKNPGAVVSAGSGIAYTGVGLAFNKSLIFLMPSIIKRLSCLSTSPMLLKQIFGFEYMMPATPTVSPSMTAAMPRAAWGNRRPYISTRCATRRGWSNIAGLFDTIGHCQNGDGVVGLQVDAWIRSRTAIKGKW